MFTLLETKKDIADAQRKLEATIKSEMRTVQSKTIGYPGGKTFGAKVNTDGEHWFWSVDCDGPEEIHPRRLNWFGLHQDGEYVEISVEINVPYEGRTGRIAGFFARDNTSNAVYLMHSGRVGGGTKGVGMKEFLSWSDQKLTDVSDSSGGIRQGVIVMPVEGRGATRSAIRYVDTIAAFKQAVRAGETETPEYKQKVRQYEDFYSESIGRRQGKRSSEIDYLSRHGEVVDAVKAWRSTLPLPETGRLVKNVLIDLGVVVGKKLAEVYEVKTSSTRQDVYSAIGQLMVHGLDATCQRIMVLPSDEPIADDLSNAMNHHKIQLVTYKMDENKTTIIGGAALSK